MKLSFKMYAVYYWVIFCAKSLHLLDLKKNQLLFNKVTNTAANNRKLLHVPSEDHSVIFNALPIS